MSANNPGLISLRSTIKGTSARPVVVMRLLALAV
jgi:hypothetical protein